MISLAPISVLLADDTPDIRMLLRASLEVDGLFEVVGEAQNGREAVASLSRSRRTSCFSIWRCP